MCYKLQKGLFLISFIKVRFHSENPNNLKSKPNSNDQYLVVFKPLNVSESLLYYRLFYFYLYSVSIWITYLFVVLSRLAWFLPEMTVSCLVLYKAASGATLTLHNRGGCEASSWWCRPQQRWWPAGRDQRRPIQLWQLCLAEEEILDTQHSCIENSDDRAYGRIADGMAKPNTGSCFFVVRSFCQTL